jgi:UDP-N-acetylglucosamine 2-epimerase (non-hydrolysing)
MPEEVNRILTDAISDLLFTTEDSGNVNLAREGVDAGKVNFVGNLMIDSLVGALELARQSSLRRELGLVPRSYAILTLHRPSNVDDKDQLTRTLAAIVEVSKRIPMLFPAHPRTAGRIAQAGIQGVNTWQGGAIPDHGVWMMPPASYLDFLGLVEQAAMVLTDSGGIQEETTYLGIPCLTYRNSTERPVTVNIGTNRLIGSDPARLQQAALEVLETGIAREDGIAPACPPLWDGRTAPRVVQVLKEFWQKRMERAEAVSADS